MKKEYLNSVAAISSTVSQYPEEVPFAPSISFPETIITDSSLDSENQVYFQVRKSLHMLGLDKEKFGTKDWNPLKVIVSEGDTVLIKPNLVIDSLNEAATITHPSVVRPIIDYVLKALNGTGKVIVADSPQDNAQLDNMRTWYSLKELGKFYHGNGFNIIVKDLRRFSADVKYYRRKLKKKLRTS